MSAVDYDALMQILSRPRPTGSAAQRDTLRDLQAWLVERGIPCRLEPFTLYPNFYLCLGLWLLGIHTLLALSVWLHWGWATALIAALGVAGGLVDTAFDFPLVTWPGKTTGQNLLIEFIAARPERELVLSAHHDSKTEVFDHFVRTFFVKNLRLGIAAAVALGVLGPLQLYLPAPWSQAVYLVSVALTFPLLAIAWGLGVDLAFGRLRRRPSQGAVDNGAACAILLGLAQQAAEGQVPLEKTRLTLALFDGEEVNMQGSRAYALGREWPLPAGALNLEAMGQDGDFVYWEQDGTALRLVPTDPALNRLIAEVVTRVTGQPVQPAGPINSDGYSFMRAGVPATTLSTYDRKLGLRGLHLPSDSLARVDMARLPASTEILKQFIRIVDGT